MWRGALLLLWLCALLSIHVVTMVRGVVRHPAAPRGFVEVATALLRSPKLAHSVVAMGVLSYAAQRVAGALGRRGKAGFLAAVGVAVVGGIVLAASMPEDSLPLPGGVGRGLIFGVRTALSALWVASLAAAILGGGAPGLAVAVAVVLAVDTAMGGRFLVGANALLTSQAGRVTGRIRQFTGSGHQAPGQGRTAAS